MHAIDAKGRRLTKSGESPVKEAFAMTRQIILCNFRVDVAEENYVE